MSIYPKELKIGESVNIHFGLSVDKIPIERKDAQIIIEIDSADSKTIFSKKVWISTGLDKNFYFKFKTFDTGKHIVTAYLEIDEQKIYSGTKDNDFFNVSEGKQEIFDLADYLNFHSKDTAYEILTEDSRNILEGKKEVKSDISKIFLEKMKASIIKNNNYPEVLGK